MITYDSDGIGGKKIKKVEKKKTTGLLYHGVVGWSLGKLADLGRNLADLREFFRYLRSVVRTMSGDVGARR